MNPFISIAAVNPLDARTLAQCFAACNGDELSLHACIRLARRLGLLPAGDYLSGSAFTRWQENGTIDFDLHIDELRDYAFEFLGE